MSAFPVLFVCVGNVCRSPYGELLLRERLVARGAGDRFTVASAGVRALVGHPMDRRLATHLVGAGGSPDGFAARQFGEPLVPPVGLVLAMTREIRSRVLGEVPGALRRTFTMLEFAELARGAHAGLTAQQLVRECGDRRSTAALDEYDVPDPIQAGDEVVARVARTLGEAVDSIAASLVATVEA